ncbi:MAG: hypothetical protein AABY14_02570, partial [Nanoarchaeota archaeon]
NLDIPEIEYTGNPKIDERLDKLISLLTERYVITDSFEDHGLRREWRREMGAKFGTEFYYFYENNKLRGNWAFIIYGTTKNIHRQNSKIPLLDISNAGYNAMTLPEKIEYVHKTEDKVMEFLYQFAKDK